MNNVGWFLGILTPSQTFGSLLFTTAPSIVRIVCASNEDEFKRSRVSIMIYLIRRKFLFINGFLPL